jgi:signal transduction histidine kinase
VVGLLFLYLILAIIVWGASRTIHRQAGALHEYASTLEVKVKERTRALEDTTKREVLALKEISRLKDDFVFIAAHELRAPVTVLEWGLDKLHREKAFFDTLPRDLKNQFAVMEKSSRRLSALIVDLLSVARLDSGTLKIEKHSLSLKEVLLPLLEEDAGVASEKEVSIVYSKEEISRIPMVLGDTMRLQEVFGNLLSNAVKFNRQGGEVRVWAEYKGSFVEVTIQDTGVGIKKEDLDKLFTKFFRGREDIEGTGLGLWISKEIMRRLNGDILVSSEEGKGTTFRVLIPRGG